MNTVTINLSLPRELLKKVDTFARKESRSRSELVRESLRAYLSEMMEWEEMFAYGRKKGKEFGITSEEDVYRVVEEFRKEGRVRAKKKIKVFISPVIMEELSRILVQKFHFSKERLTKLQERLEKSTTLVFPSK